MSATAFQRARREAAKAAETVTEEAATVETAPEPVTEAAETVTEAKPAEAKKASGKLSNFLD